MSLATLLPEFYKKGADLLFVIDPYHVVYDKDNKPIPSTDIKLKHLIPFKHALKQVGIQEIDVLEVELSPEATTSEIRSYREELITSIKNHPASRVVVMTSRPSVHQVLYDEMSELAYSYLDKINSDWMKLYPEVLEDRTYAIISVDGDEHLFNTKKDEDLGVIPNIDDPINVWNPIIKKFFHKVYMTLTKEARQEIAEQRPYDFLENKFVTQSRSDIRANHGNFFSIGELPNKIVVPTQGIGHFYKSVSEWVWNKGKRSEVKVEYFSPERYRVMERDIERVHNFTGIVKPEWEIANLDTLEFVTGGNVYIDIETRPNTNYVHDDLAALDPHYSSIMLCIFGTDENDVVGVIPNPSRDDLLKFYDALVRSNSTIIFHNGVFDLTHLSYNSGILWDLPNMDTMAIAYLDSEDGGEYGIGLKHLATMYTDLAGSHVWGSFDSFEYAAEDVLATKGIYHALKDSDVVKTPAYQLLMDFTKTLVEIHLQGVHVDLDEIQRQIDNDQSIVDEAYADVVIKFEEATGKPFGDYNINSSDQLVEMLQLSGATLTQKTAGGKYSASEKVMDELSETVPWVDALQTYKESLKTVKDFLSVYKNIATSHPYYIGYVFPFYNAMLTATSRLSCERPNIQQAPSKGIFKNVFTSRYAGGWFANVDLSGAELKMAALISQDQNMIKTMAETDFHRYCASIVFGKPESEIDPKERGMAKTVNFGLIYGGGAKGLASRIGVNVSVVEQMFEVIKTQFPNLWNWLEDTKKFVIDNKYVQSPLGQRRGFAESLALNRAHAVKREGVNSPIQGTASQLNTYITMNIMELFHKHGLKSMLVSLVHDSNQIEGHPDELEIAPRLVQQAFVDVKHTAFGQLPHFNDVEFTGELIIGKTWANCEDKNKLYNPIAIYECSTWGIK